MLGCEGSKVLWFLLCSSGCTFRITIVLAVFVDILDEN